MKPFKILYKNPLNYINGMIRISVGLWILYTGLAIQTYIAGESTSEWIINLALGVLWLIIGLFHFFSEGNNYPDITLSDLGISYKINEKTQLIYWNQIDRINIDNNTLAVYSQNKKNEELNIAHLQYQELQKVKHMLQDFTFDKNIAYSSKY